ncbi:MAG: helix-turn-helix transcriptional regulator [Alphaproteobacteria bacterium]
MAIGGQVARTADKSSGGTGRGTSVGKTTKAGARARAPARRGRGGATSVDAHVGQRLRQRRTLMGLTQERLAEALGLTFQQVQKYERGANRVGASRLFDLSRVLCVEVGYFFEGLGDGGAATAGGLAEERAPSLAPDPMARRETLELVRAYYRITDPALRRQVFDLAKALARSSKDLASPDLADNDSIDG